jgi:hypothetical protein
VSLERVEGSIPSIADVENRHVEDKHWIVHAAAAKYSSPSAPQTSPLTGHSFVRVHPLASVVEQSQSEKTD